MDSERGEGVKVTHNTQYLIRNTHYTLRITSYCLLFTAYCLLFTAPAFAQTPTISDDQVNEVAKDLYCPICESTPLDVCPTQACKDWRELIRTKLAEGQTKQQIMDYFAAQYGDRVLAEPPQQGFDLVAWLLPIGGIAFGVFFLARYLRKLQRPGTAGETAAPPPPLPSDNPYLAQIERELREQE